MDLEFIIDTTFFNNMSVQTVWGAGWGGGWGGHTFSSENTVLVSPVISHYFVTSFILEMLLNSFPTGGDFCHLLITFANSMDPD